MVKRTILILLAALLTGCPAALAQTTRPAPNLNPNDSPWLFPKDFLRGYIDLAVAPPHNEPDLGRCRLNQPCTAFARYVLSGYVEFQPFGRTPLRHFYAFFQPTTYFGNNSPQHEYTPAVTPLAMERILGMGIELPKNFELRLTNHRVTSFGRYAHSQGPTDSGPDKPLGIYTTIGVRWYFGGWGRRTHSW